MVHASNTPGKLRQEGCLEFQASLHDRSRLFQRQNKSHPYQHTFIILALGRAAGNSRPILAIQSYTVRLISQNHQNKQTKIPNPRCAGTGLSSQALKLRHRSQVHDDQPEPHTDSKATQGNLVRPYLKVFVVIVKKKKRLGLYVAQWYFSSHVQYAGENTQTIHKGTHGFNIKNTDLHKAVLSLLTMYQRTYLMIDDSPTTR